MRTHEICSQRKIQKAFNASSLEKEGARKEKHMKTLKKFGKMLVVMMALVMMLGVVPVAADDTGVTPPAGSNKSLGETSVDFNSNLSDKTADDLMGKVIGIVLTISMYVGIAILVFGVYEIVMSFTQDMPEKKVKGITLALAGVVMIGLKAILKGLGVVNG